jgi:hypothetical protein
MHSLFLCVGGPTPVSCKDTFVKISSMQLGSSHIRFNRYYYAYVYSSRAPGHCMLFNPLLVLQAIYKLPSQQLGGRVHIYVGCSSTISVGRCGKNYSLVNWIMAIPNLLTIYGRDCCLIGGLESICTLSFMLISQSCWSYRVCIIHLVPGVCSLCLSKMVFQLLL